MSKNLTISRYFLYYNLYLPPFLYAWSPLVYCRPPSWRPSAPKSRSPAGLAGTSFNRLHIYLCDYRNIEHRYSLKINNNFIYR